MKKLRTSWMAIALSSVVAIGPTLPAGAMPIPARAAPPVSDVQTVKSDRNDRIWRHGRKRPSETRHHKKQRHPITTRRHWSPAYHMWRGHRGYRNHRPGYRRYNGFWYPPAAFSLGIVVRPGVQHQSAHARWCKNHYISYRASDNTFQPYHGPRKQCVSP